MDRKLLETIVELFKAVLLVSIRRCGVGEEPNTIEMFMALFNANGLPKRTARSRVVTSGYEYLGLEKPNDN